VETEKKMAVLTLNLESSELTLIQANALVTLLTGVQTVGSVHLTSQTTSAPSQATSQEPKSIVDVAPATTPEKPKRKRRTKAELAAAKAAEAATVPYPEDPKEPAAPVANPVAVAEVVAAAPIVSAEEDKAEVVAAVGRLTADGDTNPTATVVAKMTEISGKQRVGDIDTALYAQVIEVLLTLGS
jgi:hypothetical protein